MSGTEIAPISGSTDATPQLLDDADHGLIKQWLNGRAAATQLAYRADVAGLAAQIGKPWRATTLADLQQFAGTLLHLKPAT